MGIFFKKKQEAVSTLDVVSLVERAYNQGRWDEAHRNDPRVKSGNRAEGLQRFLEREASRL